MDVYVRRWDEEVIKWLAVAMVLAMIGMAVMPLAVGELAAYYYENSSNSLARAAFMTEMIVGGAELGWIMTSAAFTGPVGWIAGAMVVGAIF